MTKTMARSYGQSSRRRASNQPQRRRRVNTDEYMYHNGGALYIPRPPSPEPVPKDDEESEEEDSSMYSSEYNNEASEMIADEPRKPKRKHQTCKQKDFDDMARPSKRLRNRGSQDKKWNKHLDELKKFKAKHGHCNVPNSLRALRHWLCNQCNRYLNPNHVMRLNDVRERERRTKELESVLGTNLRDWTPPSRTISTSGATKWDTSLEELKKFKSEHGHCRVPTSSRKLYTWLNHQRNVYLNPNHSECLQDVSERERRTKELESVLGISLGDWTSLPRTRSSTTQPNKWNVHLKELKTFKAKHGHCRVPKSFGALYDWLSTQRHRLLNLSHSKCLKDARERERRTKALESVLGASLQGGQSKAEAICSSSEPKRTTRTRGSTRRQTGR